MQIKETAILALGIIIFSIIFTPSSHALTEARKQLAGVFFADSITAQDLINKYDDRDDIKILIVPGHDPKQYGTAFGKLTEFEVNLELAGYLFDELGDNRRFDVVLAQSERGYHHKIENYVNENSDVILAFVDLKKRVMQNLINRGLVAPKIVVDHNFASNDMALTLHGINHFANKNNFDIVLHVHFNDYPSRRKDKTPKYSGFSIYLPEEQYSNSKASWDMAEYVKKSLERKYDVSNHPGEKDGLIPDQELIAIGSFNTLDAVAILIEYGYIYEGHIGKADAKTRSKHLEQMASLTAKGIESFFREN